MAHPLKLLILSLGTFIALGASPAHGDGALCSSVFSGESQAKSLESLNVEFEQLHELFKTNLNRTPENYNRALLVAEKILTAGSAKTKRIEYGGMSALEIITDEKAQPGWNKMAASLKKNYGSRLIYSPEALVTSDALASFVLSDRVVLISRESLREGRAERNVLHEIGHLKSEVRKEMSPNIFSGYVEVADVDAKPSITPNAIYYKESMERDEIPRLAQDFDRLGRSLMRATSESETLRFRAELREVALRTKEILANTRAEISFSQKVAKDIETSKHGSGPVLLEDGSVGDAQAFVLADRDTQVIVERVESGSIRLRLEDVDLTSELWIKGDEKWLPLIQALKFNDKRAIPEFRQRFSSVIQNLQTQITPSLSALDEAAQDLLAANEQTPVAELIATAMKPRRIVALQLVKQRTLPTPAVGL